MCKYYYRFPANTKEGHMLRSFHCAAQRAEQEAEKYAKKVGADTYYEDPNGFTGGVGAVVFKDMAKVNPNIWRFVGKQEENGDLMFLPNVTVTTGQRTLKEGEKTPRDNAHRIWLQPRPSKTLGVRIATYIDITPNATSASKTDRTRAVQAERWRMKLPIVRTASFHSIVHADFSSLDGTQAPRKAQESTPVFFLYHSYYYIGLSYPIRHEAFEEINEYKFNTTKRELLFEQKNCLKDDL